MALLRCSCSNRLGSSWGKRKQQQQQSLPSSLPTLPSRAIQSVGRERERQTRRALRHSPSSSSSSSSSSSASTQQSTWKTLGEVARQSFFEFDFDEEEERVREREREGGGDGDGDATEVCSSSTGGALSSGSVSGSSGVGRSKVKVKSVLKREEKPGGCPFRVDFELFQSSSSSSPSSSSGGGEKEEEGEQSSRKKKEWRLQQEHYVVYYVLSGEGKLGHFSGEHGKGSESSMDSLIPLHSGDIFVLAPRTPYYIETSRGDDASCEPLALLSISVPVTLLAYSNSSSNKNLTKNDQDRRAGTTSSMVSEPPFSRGEMPMQILEKHMETESCLLSSRLRRTTELLTFQLPNNTKNRIAPVFDPFRDCTPFTCSMEILEPEGVIPKHRHEEAYELFIVLSGRVDLYLGSDTPTVRRQGDCCLVKPGNIHSLINPDKEEKLYMLSIILPNETFAKDVWNGTYSGPLQHADVTHLIKEQT